VPDEHAGRARHVDCAATIQDSMPIVRTHRRRLQRPQDVARPVALDA